MADRILIDLYRQGGLTSALSVLDTHVEHRAGQWRPRPEWERSPALSQAAIDHTARWAAELGHHDLCEALVPLLRKDLILRCLSLACEHQRADVAKLFLSHCDGSMLRKDNCRPLRAAAESGLNELVQPLLQWSDQAGFEMAMVHAVSHRRHDTVQLLEASLDKYSIRSFAIQGMYLKCLKTAALVEDEALVQKFFCHWNMKFNQSSLSDIRNVFVFLSTKGSPKGFDQVLKEYNSLLPTPSDQTVASLIDGSIQALCLHSSPWPQKMAMFAYLLPKSSFSTEDGGFNRQKLFSLLRGSVVEDVEMMFSQYQRQSLLEHISDASPVSKTRKM